MRLNAIMQCDQATRSSPLQITLTIQECVLIARTAEIQSTMQILYMTFAFCLLFSLVLNSIIPHNPLLSLERALSNQTRKASNASASLLNDARYHCNGDLYRRNLQEGSCVNALTTIPRSSEVVTFGPRRAPVPFHVELPFRWISGTQQHALNFSNVNS